MYTNRLIMAAIARSYTYISWRGRENQLQYSHLGDKDRGWIGEPGRLQSKGCTEMDSTEVMEDSHMYICI